MITPRMIVTTFSGNPRTNLILCSSPTNVAVEKEVENFYIQSPSGNNPRPNYVTMNKKWKNSAKS